MIKIYKIEDKNNNIYVGSTTRNLNSRLSEHKCHQRHNIDYDSCDIYLLEECSKDLRYDRENYWIKQFKCVNKCLAGKGCLGYKNTEKELKRKSDQMKRFHFERPDIIKRARANSLTSENQKLKNLKANKVRIERMPLYIAIDKNTNVKHGPYQGYIIAKKELNLHETTLIRCLLHGRENRKYNFKVIDQGALSL